MIETREEKRAFLVVLRRRGEDGWLPEDSLRELEMLAVTAGIHPVGSKIFSSHFTSSDTYLSKGKAEELNQFVSEKGANSVLFDHEINPVQERNLENILHTKIIDKTSLILQIFSQHAKSKEGKLQVELARLTYLLPRLTGKGVLLSRLGGGIGTRGPGEQKLEVERRRIKERINYIKKKIKEIEKRRFFLRERRRKKRFPLVAITGYTNSGKSTLLNTLSKKGDLKVANQLFSTLDPSTRLVHLGEKSFCLVSDTVGFLRNLPHLLISAFKATLEELSFADLILCLLDASSPLVEEERRASFKVLEEVGASGKPLLLLANKIDLLENYKERERLREKFPEALFISSKTGEGIEELKEKVSRLLRFTRNDNDNVM